MFKRFTAALAVACLLFAGCNSTTDAPAQTAEAVELSDAVLNSFVNTSDEEISFCYRSAAGMTQPIEIAPDSVLAEGADKIKDIIKESTLTEIDKSEFSEDELIALYQMPDKYMFYIYNGGLIKTVHMTDRMFYTTGSDELTTAITTLVSDYEASLPQ